MVEPGAVHGAAVVAFQSEEEAGEGRNRPRCAEEVHAAARHRGRQDAAPVDAVEKL